jgi:hypothetical protein
MRWSLVALVLFGVLSPVLAQNQHGLLKKRPVAAPEDSDLLAECRLFLVRPDLRTLMLRSTVISKFQEYQSRLDGITGKRPNVARKQSETETICKKALGKPQPSDGILTNIMEEIPIVGLFLGGEINPLAVQMMRQIEPWPPPVPTDQATFTIDPVSLKNVGNFADALTERLHRAGFRHLRFWGAPDGMAVVVPLQAIDSEGRPLKPDADSAQAESDTGGPVMSIIDGFRRLLSAPIRDSRILLFILTDDSNAKNSAEKMSAGIATNWTQNGYMRLDINRDLPLTPSHFVLVNVYEFRKEDKGDPQLLTADHMLHSVAGHLAASRLDIAGLLK